MYDVCINENINLDATQIINKSDFVELHEFQYHLEDIKKINITLKNKEMGDTVVNTNGDITEDLLLVLDKILIDHIDLTNKLSKIAVYKDTNDKIHNTFNYITFNGNYTIKIHKNPLYTEWLSSFL